MWFRKFKQTQLLVSLLDSIMTIILLDSAKQVVYMRRPELVLLAVSVIFNLLCTIGEKLPTLSKR